MASTPPSIMGVWGIETEFGAFDGSDNVVRALASLAFVHYQRRLFPRRAASRRCHSRGRRHRAGDDARLLGGRDGPDPVHALELPRLRRRLRRPRPARHLEQRPRRDRLDRQLSRQARLDAGAPWGFEVRLPEPASSSPTPIPRARRRSPPSPQRGVTRADGGALPRTGEARLLIPAGLNGPIFLVTANFKTIKTYNNSTAYALGVALARRRRSSAARRRRARWPVDDRR